MGIAKVAGLLGLVTSALAATVQVDLQPCILTASSIVSCWKPLCVPAKFRDRRPWTCVQSVLALEREARHAADLVCVINPHCKFISSPSVSCVEQAPLFLACSACPVCSLLLLLQLQPVIPSSTLNRSYAPAHD